MNLKTSRYLKEKNYSFLIFCGIAGPFIFIVSFLIQSIFKKGYSALKYPISSLAIGHNGAVQIFTFICCGLLLILFSIAVQKKINKKIISILFALAGIGLIASGIFSTDPVYGYPEELPFINNEFTVSGKLHTLFSLLVFINIPIICFIIARYFTVQKQMIWKYYSVATGILMLLLFLLTGFAFNNFSGMGSFAGLIQRLCVTIGFVWIMLFAFHLFSLKTYPV